MDGHLIYEFSDEATATAMLNQINIMAQAYWIEQGFTVVEGQLIGKQNGVDNPEGVRTITWDTVKESPDGTFYFTSLSNDVRFINGTQQLIDAGFIFTERQFPQDWIIVHE